MEKTVLYYGGFRLPDKNAAAHRVVANGKILNELGYKVVYLGAENKKGKFAQIDEIQKCACGDMYSELAPKNSIEWLRKMLSTRNVKWMYKKYPNISAIVLYNVPYKTVQRVSVWAKRQGIKVIYDCTEWTAETDGNKIKRLVKKADADAVINKISKKLDGIIVISKMMEEHYKKISSVPVLRIPPLVDVSDTIWQSEPKAIEDKMTFCYAGVIDGDKDYLHYIVRAFLQAKRNDAVLNVIGVTKSQFCEAYPEFSELSEQLDEYIRFNGYLSHEETIKYVFGTDYYIFIRPSNRRNNAGFPTKFAEAYTCGIPIIATDISDIGDYFEGGKTGILIKNYSETNIEDLINSLTEKEMSIEKSPVRETFDYHNYIEKFKIWLESV